MTESQTQSRTAPGAEQPQDGQSIGQLLNEATQDVSELVRKEVQLAKLELREEATKAGKAGGKLGAAAIIGYLSLLLASFAAAWGLAEAISAGWSFLIIAVVYAIVAAVLFMSGRSQMRKVSPKPEQTMETLKEDAQWARAQTK